MIVIPDLFGSYQKGREEAIKNNWNDLAQYESIESARHQNDAAALSNLATMADFGVRRRMVQNEGTNSDLNTQLNVAQMPAKLNIAEGDSLVTGVELATLLANQDGLKQYAADKLATTFLGAGTGYNNAVVGHGKSTIGRNVFTGNYDGLYKAADGRTKADISQALSYAKYQPYITERQYQTQATQADIGSITALIDRIYAPQIAHGKNITAVTGFDAQTSGNKLAKGTSDASLITLPQTFASNFQTQIALINERQRGYEPGSNDWKQAEQDKKILQGAMYALGNYFGVPDLINYKPYAPTPTGTTSSGATSSSTGTTTYVDAATGRTITVPYATTGVGPLASGYVPYGSNGINLFTGSSQPRTLSEITANLTTPRQNVMGVPNIGNVPNSALVKPAKATVRHYLPNGQVLYTTK